MRGGFGTLDEFFEAITLTQTRKIQQFPIIVFDKAFHRELIDHIELMKKKETISPQDLSLMLVTDSIEDRFDLSKIKVSPGMGWSQNRNFHPYSGCLSERDSLFENQ